MRLRTRSPNPAFVTSICRSRPIGSGTRSKMPSCGGGCEQFSQPRFAVHQQNAECHRPACPGDPVATEKEWAARKVTRCTCSRAGSAAPSIPGRTSDLIQRVHEQRSKVVPGFTKAYNVSSLVL